MAPLLRLVRWWSWALFGLSVVVGSSFGCSAGGRPRPPGLDGGGGGLDSGGPSCGGCLGRTYTPCQPDGTPGTPQMCPEACAPGLGCVTCFPGDDVCVGDEVRRCDDDGMGHDTVVEVCDTSRNQMCSNGVCRGACEVAEAQPSNVGCEFWAVDMDQVDFLNDPASAPWGLAISNAGMGTAEVLIEMNSAPPGVAPAPTGVATLTVPAGTLSTVILPTREIDCGAAPNDASAPGTCLSSRAFRIRATAPIIVYQFNVFENAFSNDASLLLPSKALGRVHRVLGWPAGHPVDIGFGIVDRSAVTIVGTEADTRVTVRPSWRIRGNPPIAATPAGGEIVVTLGAFDVLNLETDDATTSDDPTTMADLSGTLVLSDKPVAVFSGVETTSAPGGVLEIPTGPGWSDGDTCCLDHLEDQMFPVESVGTRYVITRSPIRSTGSYHEPDVLRFVGVAETANVTTTLPAPFDRFTLEPGEVRTTWTQTDVIVTSDRPVMVGQILISNEYVDGPYTGDPSLTVFPPVEQHRSDYIILTPGSWTTNWAVISAEVGAEVRIDGATPTSCTVTPAGELEGVAYESRRCALAVGVHRLDGDRPFGVIAYGYGSAGSYAFAGGADVEPIYEPPPLF